MPRGISLHVGLNKVSSAFPSAATLKGCENDARSMREIAVDKGFKQHDVLLGSDATYARVITKIRSAAAELENGDIFLFTFSGHGFQKVDRPADGDENDRLDETILLFDVLLLDDVFRKDLWPRFKAGVRVLMIADSCHSGSVFLEAGADLVVSNIHPIGATRDELTASDELPVRTPDGLLARTISNSTAWRHETEYTEFYRSTLLPVLNPIDASVLLLAACKPFETTGDREVNGVYTAAMLNVLKDSDNYDDLVERIDAVLKRDGRRQNPCIEIVGPDGPIFRKQKPFTIEPT